jgi:hypothetical protein
MSIVATERPATRAERAWVWAVTNERAIWLRRVLRAWRDGYDAGRADGYREGREAEGAERDRLWAEAAAPIARGGPSFAELERRRYGPGGRAHFADPQPGDYAGGPVASW